MADEKNTDTNTDTSSSQTSSSTNDIDIDEVCPLCCFIMEKVKRSGSGKLYYRCPRCGNSKAIENTP